jgi:hypothetical protein
MKTSSALSFASLAACLVVPWAIHSAEPSAAFDAAPFGLPLPEGPGVLWEDPREIHRVVAHFKGPAPKPDQVHLEYWGSWWPERHLPKDHQPGGGDIGWLELGNWYSYNWRTADAAAQAEGNSIVFTFRPVTEREVPKVKDYPARFRYTFKLRLTSDAPLPALDRLETFTDSTVTERTFQLAWQQFPAEPVRFEVFNGQLLGDPARKDTRLTARFRVVTNPDPNTFDRTLVTMRWGKEAFTFAVDDLAEGPLFLPHLGVVVLAGDDTRDYGAVAKATQERGARTLYDRIAALPEQTWRAAWAGMPPKKSDIYFPLGLDGGRQRFRLSADGSLDFRSNDHYLRNRPGADTPRLALEKAGVRLTPNTTRTTRGRATRLPALSGGRGTRIRIPCMPAAMSRTWCG